MGKIFWSNEFMSGLSLGVGVMNLFVSPVWTPINLAAGALCFYVAYKENQNV